MCISVIELGFFDLEGKKAYIVQLFNYNGWMVLFTVFFNPAS
jgi:hypothetical protein